MRQTFVAAAAMIIATILGFPAAEACTWITPPVSGVAKGVLGRDINGTGIYIDRRNQAGQCSYTYLGENMNLLDDFAIVLNSQADFWESDNSSGYNLCGYGSLVYPQYGFRHIDVYAGVNSRIQMASAWDSVATIAVVGSGGNDWLENKHPYGQIWGENGNDGVWADGLYMVVHGGAGSDCMENATKNASVFNCEGGTDYYVNTVRPPSMVNCEYNIYPVNCYFEADFLGYGGWPKF